MERDAEPAIDGVWRANLPALDELPGVSPERHPWSSPSRSGDGFLRTQGLEDLVSAAEEVAAEVRADAPRPAMRDQFPETWQHASPTTPGSWPYASPKAPKSALSPATRASEWLRKTH